MVVGGQDSRVTVCYCRIHMVCHTCVLVSCVFKCSQCFHAHIWSFLFLSLLFRLLFSVCVLITPQLFWFFLILFPCVYKPSVSSVLCSALFMSCVNVPGFLVVPCLWKVIKDCIIITDLSVSSFCAWCTVTEC